MRILQNEVAFKDLVSRVLSLDYAGALLASLLFPLLFVPELGLLRTSLVIGLGNALVGLWGTWLLGDQIGNVTSVRIRAGLVVALLAVGLVFSPKLTRWSEDRLYADEIVYANLGREEGRPYVPFIATLFFFILFMNLLGLVPYGGTPTGNLAVTGVLALFSMVAIEISGIVANGPVRYAKSLVPEGVPMYLAPIMIPIEIIGHFAKPFALTVRLFANMTAGHVVILSMLGLIFLLKAWLVVPISVGFALFIFLLELLIAFIQAYIFAVLTTVFINLSRHPH
jgi:ATP synthase subunit 6